MASSRRPISLLGTRIKSVEIVVQRRVIPAAEPRLHPSQIAFCRDRAAEMRLVELMDFFRRSLLSGRRCYLVPCDIRGAFGNGSHHQLIRTLGSFSVADSIRQIIHIWLRSRTLQLKMRPHSGANYSTEWPR